MECHANQPLSTPSVKGFLRCFQDPGRNCLPDRAATPTCRGLTSQHFPEFRNPEAKRLHSHPFVITISKLGE